jgi:hypothetical protein
MAIQEGQTLFCGLLGAPASRRPNAAKGGILGENDSLHW